ncbi:amidohydrolase [Desulfopila sp. IMCC35008]|uniref:amidohydrolase n=1 Tax=Desulfopila sp. IMCC35008 TaxID=2653858 RepID=UPI00197AE706|nr:amidohydrolase [Desulfopila sp. IMCC35008]
MSKKMVLSLVCIILAIGIFTPVFAGELAEMIYHNGNIITINDAQPRVEAVAVMDGKILTVGTETDVFKSKGDMTKLIDLDGNTMLPGFFDAHGHVMGGGLQALSANILAPPDGEVKDIASLQETLREWMKNNLKAVKEIGLIVGFGYDNAQLAELRHPTRDDLDEVSKDVPIVLLHQSGHLIAVNSKALEFGGITAQTENPEGGVIQRTEGGKEPNGVLEETAAFPLLLKLLALVGPEGSKTFITAGTELWASFGYTTAQDGRTMPNAIKTYKEVAETGALKIDVVSYPDVLVDREIIKNEYSPSYKNRFRVAGAKLTIDGSPQGFTAWRDRPYYKPVGNYPPGYVGYPAATSEQVLDAIDWAYANDIQILTHSNGEAASDQLIASIDAATPKYGAGDRRPVLIHGQFLREDQVDSFKRLNIFPSLFPMHTFYWGDWHREHTVGPELADNISPTGWCVKRSMMFSSHHDAPVAFPDSMRILDATVTRRSRSGDIIGPAQRVDVMTALKAMTIWPAWQHFEEDSKGSIEVGKLADFVILDRDPTAIDPENLDQIKVTETIKEGKTVYQMSGTDKAAALFKPNSLSTQAFARMLALAADHSGHNHGQDNHGIGCTCGVISKLANVMVMGNDS